MRAPARQLGETPGTPLPLAVSLRSVVTPFFLAVVADAARVSGKTGVGGLRLCVAWRNIHSSVEIQVKAVEVGKGTTAGAVETE